MADCPFCGVKMKNEEDGCSSCGYNYRGNSQRRSSEEIFGEAREIDSKVIIEDDKKGKGMYGKTFGSFGTGDALPLWLKALYVIMTIFASRFFGLVISILLIFGGKPEQKRFGKILLSITIFLFLLNVIVGIFGGMAYFLGSGLGIY